MCSLECLFVFRLLFVFMETEGQSQFCLCHGMEGIDGIGIDGLVGITVSNFAPRSQRYSSYQRFGGICCFHLHTRRLVHIYQTERFSNQEDSLGSFELTYTQLGYVQLKPLNKNLFMLIFSRLMNKMYLLNTNLTFVFF